jgi:small subunit ribosomal protein S1
VAEMSNDLLQKLMAAQTDEERSWIVTENLLDSLPEDVANALWAAAIPHWFDAEILAALCPKLSGRADEIYRQLQNLSCVEVFPERGHNVHELTRNQLLDRLWEDNRERFRELSNQAATYFARGNKPEIQIERIYHLVVAEPITVKNELSNLVQTLRTNYRRAELDCLVMNLQQQVNANHLLETVKDMINREVRKLRLQIVASSSASIKIKTQADYSEYYESSQSYSERKQVKTIQEFETFSSNTVATAKTATATNVGFSHEDFAKLLDIYDYHFSPGDIVAGTVFSIETEGALVDIGAKTAAYIPIQEMSINRVDQAEEVLQQNETRVFFILADENGEGQLTLSIRRIEYMIAWERLRQLQAEDATVRSLILDTNRGGALVRIEGLRGFIPSSHISTRKPKEELVGEELPLKFLDVDEDRNRLVLSHRRALVECKMNKIEVGEVVIGVVRGIKPYGAFIDIGGVSGLLHISEISHEHIETPHNVFNVNDEVKVMIIDLDAERGRISLSTKQLEAEPGDMVRDPQLVYAKAEEMAAKYREHLNVPPAVMEIPVIVVEEEEFEVPYAMEETGIFEEIFSEPVSELAQEVEGRIVQNRHLKQTQTHQNSSPS